MVFVPCSQPQTKEKQHFLGAIREVKMNRSLSVLFAASLFAIAPCANAVPVSGQGTWETTLEDRDLDGDGETDAFYDKDLKITWLRNTHVNGPMTWVDAKSWAEEYSFGGFSDWRLPSAMNSNGTEPCEGFNCNDSEIGHLWYLTLGNYAGIAAINSGDYLSLDANFYWTGTSAPDSFNRWGYRTPAWGFRAFDGAQYLYYKEEQLYALMVREGDVLANTVPESESLLLTTAALGALTIVRRRKTKQA